MEQFRRMLVERNAWRKEDHGKLTAEGFSVEGMAGRCSRPWNPLVTAAAAASAGDVE